jgi:hypothetical protein
MHVKNDSVSLWGTKGYWISALVEYDRDSIRYTPFYKSLAEYGPEATLRNKLYKSLNLYGNTTVFGYEIHKDTLIEKYLDGNKNYNVKIKHTKPIISLKNKEEEAIFKNNFKNRFKKYLLKKLDEKSVDSILSLSTNFWNNN